MPGTKNKPDRPNAAKRSFAARFLPMFASRRRATVLLMVVGMLAMLFVIITAYLTLARFERLTLLQVDSRRESRRVVDALNDLLRSYIREEITNGSGEVLGQFDVNKPYNFENLPGTGSSRYLGSLEPVHQPTGLLNDLRYNGLASLGATYSNLLNLRYPAVTSFSDDFTNPLLQPYLAELLWDKNEDGVIDRYDLGGNSRDPFMDADGDGIPDTSFLNMRLGIEIANALAGRSVRVPDSTLYPPRFQSGPTNDSVASWREFERTAKYVVASRVVSHGAMLALDSVGDPGNASNGYSNVWNRRFVSGMFLQLKSETGNTLGMLDPAVNNSSGIYDEISSSSAAIEPLLRRRFLLPTWRPNGTTDPITVPVALETLETNWPQTFALLTNGANQRQDSWQRFSFVRGGSAPSGVTGRDWQAFSRAVYKEPQFDPMNAPFVAYDVRHLLTTTSNSDDLIRVQSKTGAANPNLDLALKPGTTKFDLGLINRAFRPDGTYNIDPLSASNPVNGPAIVRRLASYYLEMLSPFKDFPDTGTGIASGDQHARRREQAFMLAVNTVAASAPRLKLLGGYTDVVYASDTPPSGGGTSVMYVGYAPQPFITQVILYNEPGTGSTNYHLSLGIELYNPNDPTDPTNDEHGLPMSQYAVSINNDYETGVDRALSLIDPTRVSYLNNQGNGFLVGRSFAAFAVHPQVGGNSHFESAMGTGGAMEVPRIFDPGSSAHDIRVKLWRKSSNAAPVLIDEFEVNVDPGLNADVEWYVDTYRDTTPETADLFGDYGGSLPARWRVVSAKTTDVLHRDEGDPDVTSLASPLPAAAQTAPFIPLYVMNRTRDEGDNNQTAGFRVINGTRRPTAFPTPGFLLFVPRYSHVRKLDASGAPLGDSPPMSKVIESVWDDTSSNVSITNYPADFGHMPVFDNRQGLENNTYFDNQYAGKLPWGMLVFDYFTTLNVNDPNRDGDTSDRIDPLNIPSRININTAPWTVLAQLPVLNPSVLRNLDPNLSPAFRDQNAGVMIGLGSDGLQRTPVVDWLSNSNSTQFSDVLRLGTHLAVSMASYRDRVPYIGDTDIYLPAAAAYRNDSNYVNAVYRPDTNVYGTIRAGLTNSTTNPTKTGFASIGELLNVKGFDFNYLRDTNTSAALFRTAGFETLRTNGGDYFRAVSLLALLDTQFLTTRSNTFTVYLTVADRANAQASIRSQITVDRSNILPRIVYAPDGTVSGVLDGFPDYVTTIFSNALPQIVGQREIGYTNARYDD